MNARIWIVGCTALLVSACTDMQGTSSDPSERFFKELPEGVLAIVADNQDLTAVRIDPADGCYVYRYAGPVETTFLPLRAKSGGPICSRPAEAADPAVAG
ncbi:hypothetical protein [Pacificibacter marinus]|uniref:hypothetical protein n=1 Tax=Pacificibacter marinus TaxID=658057 RepID=UPI001C06E71D|nr:hypothetical protein [Pacificibacter marinus]MBU2867783.1 hypothetical protein [Pacificibacter marinus]